MLAAAFRSPGRTTVPLPVINPLPVIKALPVIQASLVFPAFIGMVLGVASWSIAAESASGTNQDAEPVAASEQHRLSEAAVDVFRQHCHQCHGVDFKIQRLNVLDRDSLLDVVDRAKGQQSQAFVTPGDAEASLVWEVIESGQMPPSGPLSNADQETIRRWIDAGATWPRNEQREFISETDVLRKIARHLFNTRRDDIKFQRYLTLTHLHNNRKVTARDLKIYRAALAKAVNSMSDQATIVLPEAIDDAKTIYRIDLRHYGWQEFGTWEAVLDQYPMGLRPQSSVEALEFYDKIEELYGETNFDGIASIRADWFVAHATRPPLYHTLTKIPDHLDTLLDRVGVDIERNFQLSTSRRAGLFESGVSGQNRMIEYHSSTNGTFWISYDFDQNNGRGNLARFPLGPKFEGNDFNDFAFEHAGGEIIFNLPNGLHAYMLIDGQGNRIDAGPVNIVWDVKNISGSPLIVNGLSCISCHKRGMIGLDDFVRDGSAMQAPKARRKVQELYPAEEELDDALRTSEEKYMQQLWRTIAKPLELTPDQRDQLADYEEPISRVTQLYHQNIDLETAACELGLSDQEQLRNQVFTGRLVDLGLGPLALPGGTIKRAFWDSKETTASVFQEAARALRLGTPISN